MPSLPKALYFLYTDGSCQPNPGSGGWAYVILNANYKPLRFKAGRVNKTTNNRMELQAVIEGLKEIPEGSMVTIYTDSELITKYNSKGYGKKNRDLVNKLIALNTIYDIEYVWIKGHDGNYWNEFVDDLAGQARNHS